jgi:organic hydroperoxide reductase OsmC/OhrA
MHRYTATVHWERRGATFTDRRYSRGHAWRFDGGVEVPASSAPTSVRPPYSVVEAVDPEEALVAAASSCHMLWFLDVAARAGWVVERYVDEAEGVMARNAAGKLAITRIVLRPAIAFAGALPSADERQRLHEAAHAECFIASSLTSEIVVQERLATEPSGALAR